MSVNASKQEFMNSSPPMLEYSVFHTKNGSVKNPVKHNSIPKQEREDSALRLVLVAAKPDNKRQISQMMRE